RDAAEFARPCLSRRLISRPAINSGRYLGRTIIQLGFDFIIKLGSARVVYLCSPWENRIDQSRRNYFAAFTIAIPHGPSPTLMRRNSFRDFTSTTDTSFEAPFAVYSFDPLGSSAIPQARFPTGIIATIDSSPFPSPPAERRGD